jgi:chorismate synthase
MSESFGETIRLTLFGTSHGPAVGAFVTSLPAGERIDLAELQRFLDRRAPGRGGAESTARKEPDTPEFLSGISLSGVLDGTPLCAVVRNLDTRSGDYASLENVPRPGHADYPARAKYGDAFDPRGGGHFSARLTAGLCIAGGIAKQLLARRGISVGAHLLSAGPLSFTPFDPVAVSRADLEAVDFARHSLSAADVSRADELTALFERVRAAGDSVGGSIECCVLGLPAGLGEPHFGGLESRISAAVFGIPAVKAVAFGEGEKVARLSGSENNDPYFFDGAGAVRTRTNRAGGILGGLATGMPLLFRAAIKPTPSIALPQESVDLAKRQTANLSVRGRHDACVVPRAVACVEAAAAFAILDTLEPKGN